MKTDSFRRIEKSKMRTLSRVRSSAVVSVVVFSGLCFTVASGQTSDLGTIDFPNSGVREAQPHFIRGVLLLHSFEYSDAAEEFRAAQRIDPGFAMAYWGEALTNSHLLWHNQDLDAGRAVLARLDSTSGGRLAKAPTARERAYLEAVEVLYGDGETRESRQRAYRDAMRRVHEQYPEDLEAAAFYAIAIIGAVEGGRDHVEYMKAAGIAEQVFAVNSTHPGAVHYLIHAYDDPEHVPLGMRPAKVYARVAPSAAHALHMPSHIFVAAGMWDDVVSSNRDSWASSVERMERKGLGVEEKGFHALLWLHYGLTQRGDFVEAENVLRQMKADAAASSSRRTRYHLAAMLAHHLVETEDWNNEESLTTDVYVSDLGITAYAGYHFAIGFAAARRGELELAQNHVNNILERLDRDEGDSNEKQAAGVMASELLAVIDLANGQAASAIEMLKDAVAAEASIPYSYGPPDIVKPSAELLGEVLLAQGDATSAKAAFQQSLERAPNRRLTKRGEVQSLEMEAEGVVSSFE